MWFCSRHHTLTSFLQVNVPGLALKAITWQKYSRHIKWKWKGVMESSSVNTSLSSGSPSISTGSLNASVRSVGLTHDTDSSCSSKLLRYVSFLSSNYTTVGEYIFHRNLFGICVLYSWIYQICQACKEIMTERSFISHTLCSVSDNDETLCGWWYSLFSWWLMTWCECVVLS